MASAVTIELPASADDGGRTISTAPHIMHDMIGLKQGQVLGLSRLDIIGHLRDWFEPGFPG
jgi:hypothetical protein